MKAVAERRAAQVSALDRKFARVVRLAEKNLQGLSDPRQVTAAAVRNLNRLAREARTITTKQRRLLLGR